MKNKIIIFICIMLLASVMVLCSSGNTSDVSSNISKKLTGSWSRTVIFPNNSGFKQKFVFKRKNQWEVWVGYLNNEPKLQEKGTYTIEGDLLILTSEKAYSEENDNVIEKDVIHTIKSTFDADDKNFVFGDATAFKGGDEDTLIGNWKSHYSTEGENIETFTSDSTFNLKEDGTFEFTLKVMSTMDVLDLSMTGKWIKGDDGYLTLSNFEISQTGSMPDFKPQEGDYPYAIVNEALIFDVAMDGQDLEKLKQFHIFNKTE